MLQEQQASQVESIPVLMQEANQLHANGRVQQAQELGERIVRLDPNCESALHLLGLLAMQAGQAEAAAAWFAKATVAHPSNPEHFSNLAAVLITLRRLEPAVEYLAKGLAMAPSADAHNNMGAALQKLGRFAEAIGHCRQAVQLRPSGVTMWVNLANALGGAGALEESADCYAQALKLEPNNPDALLNFGNLQVKRGEVEEGMQTFLRLLQMGPNNGPTHNNVGNLYQGKGQHAEATQHFRRALALTSGGLQVQIFNSLLYNLALQETISAADLFQEHAQFAETYEAPLRALWPQHGNSRDPERVLRVGIISGDLRHHAVASFVEPLLVHLAQSTGLKLHAYYNHSEEDAVSLRLKGYFEHWQGVLSMDDENLVKQVQQDGIDILIDLSGHTGLDRLLAFARKPAPIQISWMGYPGTTGLTAMDYYLTDRYFAPVGMLEDQFTEKLVRLPASAPFLPHESAPEVNALPALSNGYLTFGSFNRPNKIGRSVVALWAQLLRALPDARLLLGAMTGGDESPILSGWFPEEGVDTTRLQFFGKGPMTDYLALHHQVDVCLDTFPYNGGTTTWHAVWMGVPTLTLTGKVPASRSGVTVLGHMGLQEFSAATKEEFVAKGVALAKDWQALSQIRNGLRARFAASPVGRPTVIAAGLERALRRMWQQWCEGLPPESFEVDSADLPANAEVKPVTAPKAYA